MSGTGYASGSNREEQGGALTTIGGQLDIITTEGGAGVTVDGVNVTPRLSGTKAAFVADAPAGGTGAAAGGWDTAGHRDTAIATINAMKACLIANGLMAPS